MAKRFIVVLFFSNFYFSNSIQAQKACRQNYKNEASLSYNNLMSFVLGSAGLSYEYTIVHKKDKNNYISVQLEYASKLDLLLDVYTLNRIATKYFTPSLKYNFGDKHIYSIGVGVVLSFLNTTPASFLNYKYDFRKYKFTIGCGLQLNYLGLAKTKEYYNPTPTVVVTGSYWSPYSYDYSWRDHILFNIRVGKYF
jgi:hypothetical protein